MMTQEKPQPSAPPLKPSPGEVAEVIWSAGRGGSLKAVVAYLDKYPHALDAQNGMGRTLLTEAAAWGRREIVALLCTRGADADLLDDVVM